MKIQKKKIQRYVRAAIQLLCFIFFSSAFTAAFGGVKYIAAQLGAGEKIEWTAFVAALAGLCAFTVVFGRFFCGMACAFGSLGDAVHALYRWTCKKLKKKSAKLSTELCEKLSAVKYLVLATIVALSFFGLYGKMRGTSPWDVFSMVHAGNLRLAEYIPGTIVLLLIIGGMCVQERFFCRFLCPMGAVFSLLPVLPFFALRRDREECLKGCSGCTRKCPSDIELAADGSYEMDGDCFQCQKCIGTCPKENIHCGWSVLRGNEILFTLLRTGLLIGLYLWIGI